MSAAVTVQGNEDRTHITLSDVAQDSVQLRGIVRGLVVLCHPLPDGAHATPTPRPRLRHASLRVATAPAHSLNNFVPSLPATRISSSSPPGWKRRYGVILYTIPLNALHASSRDLC